MNAARVAFDVHDEAALTALAGTIAVEWRAVLPGPLLVGLSGPLGAGKTTWTRAMLSGLGYEGRVPSPTYTLLEHYALAGLDLIHVDLYRLGGHGSAAADADAEIDSLGLRDWLARPHCWLLVEWAERAPLLDRGLDVRIAITPRDETGRHVEIALLSAASRQLEAGLRRLSESTSS